MVRDMPWTHQRSVSGWLTVTVRDSDLTPDLRQRISDVAVEYRHGHEDISRASTAQRLTYWRKSASAVAQAPLLGHGTGSIKRQFERAATGESSLDAEIVSNPHNQTLNVAVQWGLTGVVALYAMWLALTPTSAASPRWVSLSDSRASLITAPKVILSFIFRIPKIGPSVDV